MSTYNPRIKDSFLELYTGPMKCGKSLALIHRVQGLQYMNQTTFTAIKPAMDVRDPNVIRSRFDGKSLSIPSKSIDENNPSVIFNILKKDTKLVVIDELQFFKDGIEQVVIDLLSRGLNVVGAGLDTDFRAEPFEHVSYLLSIADQVTKLTGVCEYHSCNQPATRTQRLHNGKPASYNTDRFHVETTGKSFTYQCRCLKHHEVKDLPEKTKKLILSN
jgi:thymidine kinase